MVIQAHANPTSFVSMARVPLRMQPLAIPGSGWLSPAWFVYSASGL
jgi:hypothetical protein